MRRRQPPKAAPGVQTLTFTPDWIEEERTYEVITFLMGGGVEPYEADPITTVRAAEIKGWLRYWWRATRGGGNLDAMRQHEAEIWGWSAGEQGGPSKVVVEVETLNRGRAITHVRARRDQHVPLHHWRSPYSYVAFPLQTYTKPVLQGLRFALHLRYPKIYQQDVHAALWAWEVFGGIGARTRRGFGALKRMDEKASYPDQTTVIKWIQDHLRRYAGNGTWPSDVPHLSSEMDFSFEFFDQDPLEVWKNLIRVLKDFRQMRRRRFGRSLWPEPDEIRDLFQTNKSGHEPSHKLWRYLRNKTQSYVFPRGQMGLPIVFQFKDEERGDPPKSVLIGPGEIDRWASRLILKPLPCRNGFVGLAAVLEGPNLTEAQLKEQEGSRGWEVRLEFENSNEAEMVPPLRGEFNVLQAFIDFLKHSQKEE